MRRRGGLLAAGTGITRTLNPGRCRTVSGRSLNVGFQLVNLGADTAEFRIVSFGQHGAARTLRLSHNRGAVLP